MQSLHVYDYFCYREWNVEENFALNPLSNIEAQSADREKEGGMGSGILRARAERIVIHEGKKERSHRA